MDLWPFGGETREGRERFVLFNSIPFMIFAPVFYLVYFGLKGRARLAWCIIASCFFYGWWDWRFVGLLAGSTLISFYSGLKIGQASSFRARRGWLWFCVLAHLLALGLFKYLNFGLKSLNGLLHWAGIDAGFKNSSIILPIGISFITFTALSYIIDVYRGKIDLPEHDLLAFATYRCLFPQLVAGPILRAPQILPQLKIDHAFDWARAGRGLEMVVWGYVLKLCLADNAALFASPRFENPELFTSFSLLLAILAFALQVYGDFAGYSLIAIGLAHIMGYDFPANFDRPYLSTRISDFWRRWHITLSTWFRDYVFLPTSYALSRRLSKARYFGLATELWLYLAPTLLTMLLVGLWHGASVMFLFWGLLHGLYLSGQRILHTPLRSLRRALRFPRVVTPYLKTPMVFGLVCVGWIFFKADSMDKATYILKSVFSLGSTAHLSFGGMKFVLLRLAVIASLVVLVEIVSGWNWIRLFFSRHVYARVFLAGLATLVILFIGNFAANTFIYFQF